MSVGYARPPALERVPPKRRKVRKSFSRRVIWPVAKLSVVIALAAFLGTAVAGKIARPFQLVGAEGRELKRLSTELAALKKENVALERQIQHLRTPQGVAGVARKLGYVKPGEITLVVPEEHSSKDKAPPKL